MRIFTSLLLLISPAFLTGSARVTQVIEGASAAAVKVEVKTPVKKTFADPQRAVDPQQFVAFAKTLIGVPYLYASTDPARGFDCSGFVYYVARHFGMSTPRSSADFAGFGTSVSLDQARVGDLILFTGTDVSSRRIGHIGIVSNVGPGGIEFVHSSSGKGKGVIVSPLEGYYEERFMKLVRPDQFLPNVKP